MTRTTSELYKNTKGAKEIFTFAEATPKAELKDTVELMLSKNYKDRFDAEVMQLEIRIEKLSNMIDKHRAGTLEFKLSCPIELLECQLLSMKMYLGFLKDRKAFESVAKEEKSDEKEPTRLITREEASCLLFKLANSEILDEKISDKLMEIASNIDDEMQGYHFWGATVKDISKLFTAYQKEHMTKELKKELGEIACDYIFIPSDNERDEISKYVAEVGSVWDEENE